MKRRKSIIDISRLAFWSAVFIAVFFMGGEFATRYWQPWKFYDWNKTAAMALIRQAIAKRPLYMEKIKYTGNGVTKHAPARVSDGLTLMQGWFAEGPEVRLVDIEGKVVHKWPADFFSVWPAPTHIVPETRIPATKYNFDMMGMSLLPDGSLLFNFSELGSVKMDKCGNVQWTIDHSTHHSVTLTPDGSFWIPEKRNPEKVPDELLLYGFSRDLFMRRGGEYEDRLLLVDANGVIKKEISVLQALVDAGFEHQLIDAGKISRDDPTHVNDIEIVTPALANKITGIQTGDLLISIRNLHMLAVLDQNTGKIKWHQTGPWVRQHDPDITDQGNIELFNNRTEYDQLGRNADRKTGSNIISLDPATGKTTIVYPLEGNPSFYTKIMGNHQLMKNGNRLIVESMYGRVFEVDEEGNTVWEYIKPYDDDYSAMIQGAIRYEKDYIKVKDWDCS